MDVQSRIALNRRRAADFFDSLDEGQLSTRSLCDAWTVREVLGHLAMPLVGGAGGFLLQVVRSRGSIDRANAEYSRAIARRPVGDLTAVLREQATVVVKAPGVGPMGQMADGCLHLRDCARPLGLPDSVDLGDWRMLLDYAAGGVRGLVPRGRLDGLHLVADDQEWSWGGGPEVAGASEALVMAAAGRRAALADLIGPGRRILEDRLSQ